MPPAGKALRATGYGAAFASSPARQTTTPKQERATVIHNGVHDASIHPRVKVQLAGGFNLSFGYLAIILGATMGEARYRAKYDPTFGKIPKITSEIKNGLVLSPPLSLINGELTGERLLKPEGLRFAALFFDELALPVHQRINWQLNDDSQFLEKAGILQLVRPHTVFGSSISNTEIGMFYHGAARYLNQVEPGKWSFATGEDFFNWDIQIIDDQNPQDISVELIRAVPIPDILTPLEEILEFRARRRDELLGLRTEIGVLADDVLKSGNMQSALNDNAEKINIVCSDFLKSSRNSGIRMKIGNLQMKIAVDAVNLAIGLSELAKAGNFVEKLLGGLATGKSLLNISKIPKNIGVSGVENPFQYAYHAYDELLY